MTSSMSRAAATSPDASTPSVPVNLRECIARCQACHSACVETIQHCLTRGGEHAAPAHIRLMIDCAQVCTLAADVMLRGSEGHVRVCFVCAEFCQECADDCERLGRDDPGMQACVEACRACALACREAAGVTR